MVQNTGHLSEQCTDILGSFRDFNVQQLLNSQRVTLFIRHHGDIVQSVEVRQSLHVGLVFDQLLGTTMKQSDVRIRADNLFTIDLQNQSKHTVSSRMLRTEVDCVVTDFAADPFTLGFETSGNIGFLGTFLVSQTCEGGVSRNKSGSLEAGRLRLPTRKRRCYRAGSGDGVVFGEVGGAETEPFGRTARQASKGSSHSEERGEGRGGIGGCRSSVRTQLM